MIDEVLRSEWMMKWALPELAGELIPRGEGRRWVASHKFRILMQKSSITYLASLNQTEQKLYTLCRRAQVT
jgi:hypothetical protein